MSVSKAYQATANGVHAKRKSYGKIAEIHPVPSLVDIQLESFRWFREEGLRQLFDEISPIESFNKNLRLYFLDYYFGAPRYSEDECRERDITYSVPLSVTAMLENKETGEILKQEVFMGDFPLMTERATFIINGAERVVVSQLIRSPGAYFSVNEDRVTGRKLCVAKLIPDRGAWLEFETSKRDVISVKVNRKRKIPVTVLLRAIGHGTDEELIQLFAEAESSSPDHSYIRATIDRDGTKSTEEALIELFKILRPGEPRSLEKAKGFVESLLFDQRRYDLGRVGRYKLNKRLDLSVPLDGRALTAEDLMRMVEIMIRVNNGVEEPDDIDHLGNRRVKTVGELVQSRLRIGLLRLSRMVRQRMSISDPEQATPLSLINIRPMMAALLREFFGSSQLSQFMDQTNPLAELQNKRRLSALGPGGLRRERAGFDVRDVHHSHYGRICPIETPEGPNIGLIGSLATYARVNEYGFIETPCRRVINRVPNQYETLLEKTLRGPVVDPISQEVIAKPGTIITPELAGRLAALPFKEVRISPMATQEIVYLTADEEDRYRIAQASSRLNERGEFVEDRVSVRHNQRFMTEAAERVDFMDISPKQVVGVSAALIPFLEHDDANRALMGSNMQRQAVPLIKPEPPIVGTGMEWQAALDSGQMIIAEEDGEVLSVASDRIVIQAEKGIHSYPLRKYRRSNQSTCIDQRPVVSRGDWVRAGEVIADSSSTYGGLLSLGQNVLVAFMPWGAGNFEDAILISEGLVREDKFTSVHIEKHEIQARDTKLGPEEITRDIPNVGEDALRDLDEDGIIRIGAEVFAGDILVGKITPKGETELTPEEKLLRAIFGEKARGVKDSSLRLSHGEKGRVVGINMFTREENQDLPVGVSEMVRVSTAERRKITEGDKMSGHHGNKGVISRVVPVEDMPFLADGTPVEIILNTLGVPSRMNIGQIFETHLGWAADRLGFEVFSPVFDGADEDEIRAELARAWLIDRAWADLTRRAWEWVKEQECEPEDLADGEEVRRLYLRQVLGGEVEDLEVIVNDGKAARRAFLKHWLEGLGYDVRELFGFEDDGDLSAEGREKADREVEEVCLRLWMEHHGLATEGIEDKDLREIAERASRKNGWPLPTSGKMLLSDGRTGEPFDRPVTVGIIYMMKLDHLVEDKMHARSTGPYSLVTQQPLGGKAQFGGQRFGEMEVWALEAYGAAHALQEMLTIKSDDVTGRGKTYEAIVKGEDVVEAGVPESFNVLVRELQGLGLSVEVFDKSGRKMKFGREEVDRALPRLGWGLMSLPRSRWV